MRKFLKYIGLFIIPLIYPVSAQADDFTVSGSLEQSINIEGIQTIQIYCYCESGFVIKDSLNKTPSLKVNGTHGSGGYHGEQKIPKEVSKGLLSFKETRIGSTLKLESHEYTYIHHAYLINHLEIFVPPTINVELIRLKHRELEGRQIN